jgi:SNF family Na+-dependent transporter
VTVRWLLVCVCVCVCVCVYVCVGDEWGLGRKEKSSEGNRMKPTRKEMSKAKAQKPSEFLFLSNCLFLHSFYLDVLTWNSAYFCVFFSWFQDLVLLLFLVLSLCVRWDLIVLSFSLFHFWGVLLTRSFHAANFPLPTLLALLYINIYVNKPYRW